MRGKLEDTPISNIQVCMELKSAQETVDRLADVIRLVGDVGVTDPQTANELEIHLGAAHAAAYRWLLEARLQADNAGVALPL